MLFGAHESINGGFFKAVEKGKEDGCDCIQIFTKSPKIWSSKPIKNKDIELFKNKVRELNIKPNVAHASYLINLSNSDNKKRNFAIINLIDELNRGEKLELYGVVVHPGSNKNKNEGINNIIDSINKVLTKTRNINLFIENIAGSGNWIGSSFEELKKILEGVKNKKRFGFCFDTCHAWVAGYDIKNNYEKVFNEFNKIIGIKWIKCFHLNDAMFKLGSKKDRHANIGEGFIGLKGFKQVVNDKRFNKNPGYLETPGNDYSQNIKILKELIIK